MINKERLPIMLFAMICLFSGLWGGLTRIGWNMVVLPVTAHHGAVMVGGFLGTLIALEKVIPLKKKFLLLIPILNALSIVFFFFSQPKISIYILIISSACLSLVFLYYLLRHRNIIYLLMSVGALCWLTGNITLLTRLFYPIAFPWWIAFILLIITAERLELMKFLPVSKAAINLFLAILLCFLIGCTLSFHGIGSFISGLALMGISSWLMRHDVISINMKKKDLPKFVGISLLCGYIALLLTGIFAFSLSDQWLTYDAIVHTFFLGFAFSMIFAHGPIILPGILGISITPFSKILYGWLFILQTSWIIRIFADVMVELNIRKISGLLSTIAILGYFITLVILTVRSMRYAKAH